MWRLSGSVLAVSLLLGCASVERVDTKSVQDYSGRWNDSDSRLMAEDVVNQSTNMPWLSDFQIKKGRKPVLVVNPISNRTEEHINTGALVGDIERAMVNSGKVDVIASSNARNEIRQERREQGDFADQSTKKSDGHEIGSDVMLTGTMTSIVDAAGRNAAVFYQLDVRIVDVETGRMLWTGQSKVKKLVSGQEFRP